MSTLRTEYEPIIYCTRNRIFYFHFFFYSVVIIVVSRISVADYSMAKYTESENKRTRVFHAFLSSKPFVDAVIFRWFRDFDMINSDLEHVELNWKFLKIELNNSMIVGRDDAGLTTNWYDHELETYQFVLHGICSLISCILFFFSCYAARMIDSRVCTLVDDKTFAFSISAQKFRDDSMASRISREFFGKCW